MSDATAQSEQILITRIFDAPREEVFRAWTDPGEVAAWFGPEHFDTRDVRIDLRVGGRYELTMVRRMTMASSADTGTIAEVAQRPKYEIAREHFELAQRDYRFR